MKSLLIANRGEIACRIIRTARRLGVRTIAIYSDADTNALHVRQADQAIPIGGLTAKDSYLNAEKILAAARQTNADSIHPGYGFLSENPDFAEHVTKAGLIWVGAPPAAMGAMGQKDAAKRRMAEAGVPTTPGYAGEDQSDETLLHEAEKIGFPILIKAISGGGGKGMREVTHPKDFAAALQACRREALSFFSDDRVLLERLIQNPRHIEVQIFADKHGNIIHLFERDCSVQRRHQKIIEEAPAPGMDPATRETLCAIAIKAAQAVDYAGAGTIEFIADNSEGLRPERIWFMEMNTRLQVEHPVTEEITGLDLVEWQLRIAAGEPLPRRQSDIKMHGHAIEARLYAEDPAKDFLPSVGHLDHFKLGPNARIETGVAKGSEISPYYDPMIAKLITTAPTRAAAITQLAQTLRETEIWPLRTNAGFLLQILQNPQFAAGPVTTNFTAQNTSHLLPPTTPPPDLAQAAAWTIAKHFVSGMIGPWATPSALRLNAPPANTPIRLKIEGKPVETHLSPHPTLQHLQNGALGFANGIAYFFTLEQTQSTTGESAESDGTIIAPMPATIVAIDVINGQKIEKGERLLVLTAMKMELALTAPFAGTVTSLSATTGAHVRENTVLLRIESPKP